MKNAFRNNYEAYNEMIENEYNYRKFAFHNAFEKETAWAAMDEKTTASNRYLEKATSLSR